MSQTIEVALYRGTYALSRACADVVRQASPVVRITHEDGCLDRCKRVASKSSTGATAQSVVDNLSSLGVSDQHDLRAGASLVQAVNSRDHGSCALARGLIIGDAAAASLSTAGRIADRRRLRAGVSLEDPVDEALGGAVSGRRGCLAGAEDVDTRAALTGLDVDIDGSGGGKAGEEGKESSGLHDESDGG